MTYDPNRRDRPDILRKRDDSMSGALTGGIAIALLLFGVAIFTLSSGNRDIVATDKSGIERPTPAPSTTGQGGSQVIPDRGPYVPNPTPPSNPSPSGGAAK